MDIAWLFPIGMIVVVGLLAWFDNSRENQTRSGWQIFAERNGFALQPRSGFVYAIAVGGYCGREVTLRAERRYEKSRWQKRYTTNFTQIRLPLRNPKAVSMHCDNHGTVFALDALARKVGLAEPLRTGNGVFDAMFHFTGEPGDVAVQLMQDLDIQGILRGLQPTDTGTVFVRLDQTGLVYERSGLITNPDQLQRLLEIGCALASVVEERLTQV